MMLSAACGISSNSPAAKEHPPSRHTCDADVEIRGHQLAEGHEREAALAQAPHSQGGVPVGVRVPCGCEAQRKLLTVGGPRQGAGQHGVACRALQHVHDEAICNQARGPQSTTHLLIPYN